MAEKAEITGLLKDWAGGSESALDNLTPLVYDELQRVARRIFSRERSAHTLQPTALVNEVFANLIDADVSWQNRAHFYSLSARMMRRILINHANARAAGKRGGDAVRVTLNEGSIADADADADAEILELDEALSRLGELDPRKAELVELQYFGGLTFREMEEVTGLSSSTLDRELRFSRAWLKDRLSKD